MKAWIVLLSVFIMPLYAGAADLMIFDVRRNLRMADTDVVFHDYYVNGGNESGLNNGMIITVTRKLPLYDNYQNHSAGDLMLKVAKLKIIHVQKGLAVGRLQSEFTRENAPMLEDPFIMVGDILDLSTATHDGKKAASEGGESTSTAEVAQSKPVASITVNSVELSSQAPPTPVPVDTQTLQ